MLINAALHNSSGYQSDFIFIASAWLFGSVALAIFGPAPGTHASH
ncbi:hypothetical protein NG819_14555 [Pseudarthrobacter sp. Fe7]|nr:hypothetical protein NG819_14555 [Pseudarthrobacter sp. Fe7]